MYVIVVGAGEVGTHVADILSREGHDVAVIEKSRTRHEDVRQRLDVLAVRGSATSPEVLLEAGSARANLLVAATSSDETNLVACLLARHHGVERTIARLEDEALRSLDAKELHDAIGIDLVIDPDAETADEILELLEYPGAADVVQMGGGELIVLGARLQPGAPLVGRTLFDVAQEYEPEWEFLFGSISRGAETIIPRGNQTLEANDLLRVICKKRARPELMDLMGLPRGIPRKIMLLGGGRTAEFVAKTLSERGVTGVKIVERNHERAVELATKLDHVLVLEGEITDADLLAEEDVGNFDAVVALTGEDDANVLACLYAKSAGATETIAVVHRLSLLPLLQEVGIDAALSPRTASANGVLRFVRGGVAQVATFLQGEAEVLELEVAEGSPADGSAIAELRLPADVLVGAIVRDGKAQIGRGRSILRDRDHIVVFAMPHSVDEVKKVFG